MGQDKTLFRSQNTCTPVSIPSRKEWRKEEWEHKPLLIYDGDCGFCAKWVKRWKNVTGEKVVYAPSRDVACYFPKISPKEFERSVQLVMPDGRIYSGAHAVFHTLEQASQKTWLLYMYEHVPGFAPLAEFAYRFIASHRS